MKHTVLFVDHAPELGGAERSLLSLMEQLASRAWKPHLVCGSEVVAQAAAARGIPAVINRFPRLRGSVSVLRDLIHGAKEIACEAESVGAEILHANTLRGAAYTAAASIWNRRPFVWHMRDISMREPLPKASRYRDSVDALERRWLAAMAQRILCNSDAVAARFASSHKVEVVRNGIDLSQYDPQWSGSRFRRQYGIPDDSCLVSVVGRLRRWKRYDRFVRIAEYIGATCPSARFSVVGGNPLEPEQGYRAELEAMAVQKGLGGRFVFTGHLDDVRPALAATDVFVHCFEPEGFGLVNLEAMAMELPVVAFAHGALSEIVVDQQTGVLIPPGNEDEMARAVIDLILHPERRRALGRRGRGRVEAEFTSARVAEQVSAIYECLLPGQLR